ncbi:MAG: DNA repair protein RecO [Calditrichia bacterium]
MQTLKTEALVVQSMRWSDTSKIVHLFCEEKGYLKVIAKGAMRPKSQFRGVLENLNRIEAVISVRESRGLQIISQAALTDPYSNIREDLSATAIAYSMMEIIKAFVHYNEAARPLFQFTVRLLESLNRKDSSHPRLHLFRFILFVSDYLGFGWNSSECRVCGREPRKFPLKVDLVNGAVICPDCRSELIQRPYWLERFQWELLVNLQDTSPEELHQFLQNVPEDTSYRPLLEMLLAHINYHTDQTLQLKSLKMYIP